MNLLGMKEACTFGRRRLTTRTGLLGARVGMLRTLALVFTAVTCASVLLGAFAPIALVFSLSEGHYVFLQIFHFGVWGLFGLVALIRSLSLLCERSDVYPRYGIRVLLGWLLMVGFVGVQLAWATRPYVGHPSIRLELVRLPRYSNIYVHMWRSACERSR